VSRDRARDEQQVRVPGTRDETNAQPLDVVEGIVERMKLELAAVAGAGVDMTYAQRAPDDRHDALM
jgi:hypothetical protein